MMFTFWYAPSFQILVNGFKGFVQAQLKQAAQEHAHHPQQAKKRKERAQRASDCLEGIIEIKHFLYFHKEEPSKTLIVLLMKRYCSSPLTREEQIELQETMDELGYFLSKNNPSFRKHVFAHRINYLVWVLSSLLFCIHLAAANNANIKMCSAASALFCFLVGITGLACNASVRHEAVLDKIQLFMRSMDERDNELMDDIYNNAAFNV